MNSQHVALAAQPVYINWNMFGTKTVPYMYDERVNFAAKRARIDSSSTGFSAMVEKRRRIE